MVKIEDLWDSILSNYTEVETATKEDLFIILKTDYAMDKIEKYVKLNKTNDILVPVCIYDGPHFDDYVRDVVEEIGFLIENG